MNQSRFLQALVLGVFLSVNGVQAATLATILGTPDRNQPFVRQMLEQVVDFDGQIHETNWTTQLFSILSRRAVRPVISIEIVRYDGGTTYDLVQRGAYAASNRARVVFTAIGGGPQENNQLCQIFASFPAQAYVLSAGKSGYAPGEGQEPACMASNILRVGALNRELTDLSPWSNFGPTVRIAAPGTDISVVGGGGVPSIASGTAPAAAAVAAELSNFAEIHPELSGASLIYGFLQVRTVVLPSLYGKVAEGRALTF